MSDPVKPVRVCFATNEYPPDMGGVSKSARRVVHLLKAAAFDIHVFAPIIGSAKQQGELVPEIVEGVKVYRVPCNNVNNIVKPFYEAIRQADLQTGFDIFHGFFLFMAYPCILVASKKNKPVIASFRGIDAVWMDQFPFNQFAKEILKKASWITSVSSDSLKLANTICDISSRSSFIFNSIQVNPASRWRLTPANRKVVGTVSTFREKKNIPLLLSAYAQLAPDLRKELLLVGDFIENKTIDEKSKEQFEKLIFKYNIKPEVTITGYLENNLIHEYLLKMHVFVLSSKHEGLPNALLEAASVGLPLVSTAVDGVKDIIIDGKNGLLVPSENVNEMKKAIEAVISDDGLAEQLSAGALDLVGQLSPAAEKQAWVDLYRKLLAR